MEESNARARLVDVSDDSVSPALTTTISRREVEDALRTDDGPMDLVLDITRWGVDDQARTAVTEKIAVSWEREDLEDLLQRAAGDSVTLAFDGQALLRALETDVEAHGIREGLAVLAVAVVAGSAAGVAAAQPQAVETGGVAPATDIEAVRVTQPLVTGAGAAAGADIEAARAAQLSTTGAQSATDSGISVSMPGAATAAVLIGGIALLITGAAFVARGKRLGLP